MNRTHNEDQTLTLVTGASRGIGLAVACLLSLNRVPLMLTARGKPDLLRARDALRETGADVYCHSCDASDEKGMSEAFSQAASVKPIGSVFNNAGVLGPIAPIRDVNIAEFESHLATNVTGVLVGIKQALAHHDPGQCLRIVNVSSGAAAHGYRSWAAYCASKAAVNLLTEVAAMETDDSVSVVAVAPGVIETRMQKIIRSTPVERFPDVGKFQELKESGALLHPVAAGQALVWLLRQAPPSLSGQCVDARDKAFLRHVPAMESEMMIQARTLFNSIEQP